MSVFEIVGGVIMIVMGVFISILVLLQEGSKGGMSALSGGGGGDSFLGKNQGRTRDAMLFKGTRFCGIVFFVVTIVVYALDKLL